MAEIILKNVRLSFPDLWKPGTPPPGAQGSPKFGAQFIFSPDSDAYRVAVAEFKRVAAEKFGKNSEAILAELPRDKKCLRKGDSNLDKAGEVRDGYAGNFFIVARNGMRPIVIDRNKAPLTEADGKPYGGCYVNAKIDIYAHDKPGLGKRVDASLLAVQFVGDGEAFGGAAPNAEGFEALDDEPAANGSASDLF